MLKIPYAGCLGLSQAISVQFTLEIPILGVQGRWSWCQSKGRMGLPISN